VKAFRRQKNQAFAVLVVMVVITCMTILATGLAIFLKVETQLTATSNDTEQLLWIGRAGAQRACWILSQEPPGPSSLQQIWAGGPGVGPETNSPLAGISLKDFPVGAGAVDLEMTEQESKFNVNTADAELLRQILTTMGVDAGQISDVADSIQDWIDPDDATKPAGAESDVYQGMTPPYNAKNAPMDSIEELQLIKGITPELFKGGTANTDQPFKRHRLGFGAAPGQAAEYPFGLRDVLTPYSSGRININTASSNVLACVPGMDGNSVAGILTLRDSTGDALTGDGVIRDISVLRSVIPNPQALSQLQRYAAVQGNTYEVRITARVGSNSREYVAVIIRGPRGADIVSFYPK
jgi:general secretion pathway protein K